MYPPEVIAEAERNYNEMARAWNSLPGSKLTWPEDKFVVRYCECKKRGRTGESKYGLLCYGCGYLIIGE